MTAREEAKAQNNMSSREGDRQGMSKAGYVLFLWLHLYDLYTSAAPLRFMDAAWSHVPSSSSSVYS